MSSGAGTLGRYQIIREIARSNDIVYEAYDPAMNRRVAVKELAVPHGATEKQRQERLARFQREAKAAGSLTHPNIVTIYEVGDDAGRAFIAMEYLEGQNLRQRMDAEGPLPQDEAVRIIVEVLEALAYAHERGVVHRDIKPDNVQLLPDGRVKITDFGIARLMFEPSLTMDGQIFGTPSYMSPEQVVGRDIDVRTDVWSCGVVLYEAISGEKPFSGDSVVTISHAIMHLDPSDPPKASYAIAQVIQRALDKFPSQRYASAKAMAKALREAIEALKSDPVAPTVQPAQYPSPWGAPLDPYAQPSQPQQQPAPPVYTSPGSVYGQPYGQAYGLPYGGGGQVPPPTPYPPGWVSPPPSGPLVSPEVAEFVRRTLIVIIVGGALLAIGIAGVVALNNVVDQQRVEQYNVGTAERLAEEAQQLRELARASVDVDERIRLLAASADSYARAADLAGGWTLKEAYHRGAAVSLIALASEYRAVGRYEQAELHLQQAIRHADAVGADEESNTARGILREIGGTVP